MQIRMFAENNINVTSGRVMQEKRQSAQAPGSVFDGPQCKVTISKEGRRLSRESEHQQTRSARELKTEKMMLREQEQQKQSDAMQGEYAELIEEIDRMIKTMQNANMPGEDIKTIEDKQRVIREMRDQKSRQMEENQKKAKEAQQMAMQSSEVQDEIDEKNRDLYIMLKSIEESEKAEEEREGGEAEGSDGSDGEAKNSASDAITNMATRFTTSSMRRELDVTGMIQALKDEGYMYLAKSDEIARNAFDEAEMLKRFLKDENTSDAEKKAALISYGEKMARDSSVDLEIMFHENFTDEEKQNALSRFLHKMVHNSDMSDYRRRGMQMVRDAKECKSDHIADNPLQGMEETRDSMIQSAVNAAFNEASQGKLDEASQELEDAVEELIDERNDIDPVEPEEKKDEEEQEQIGELLEPKNDEENPNAEEEKLLGVVLES